MDTPDKAQDLQYLKDKVDCGADFILSQLFYDVDVFKNWVKKCRDLGMFEINVHNRGAHGYYHILGITVPIIPSILPIPTHQSFRRIINLCRIQVPKTVLDKLEEIKVKSEIITMTTTAFIDCIVLGE